MNVAASRFHASIVTKDMVLSVFAPATATVYTRSTLPPPTFEHTKGKYQHVYESASAHECVWQRLLCSEDTIRDVL